MTPFKPTKISLDLNLNRIDKKTAYQCQDLTKGHDIKLKLHLYSRARQATPQLGNSCARGREKDKRPIKKGKGKHSRGGTSKELSKSIPLKKGQDSSDDRGELEPYCSRICQI